MPAAPPDPSTRSRASRAVVARVLLDGADAAERRFTGAFVIGSGPDADVQLLAPEVAPAHAEVLPDGILWWIRDLSGKPGTWIDGVRTNMVPLRAEAEIALGPQGPRVRLEVVTTRPATATFAPPPPGPEAAADLALGPAPEPTPERARTTAPGGKPAPAPARPSDPAVDPQQPPTPGGFRSETQILRRFLRKKGSAPEGHETRMFRRAFERAQQRSSLPYQLAAGAALVALVVAAMFIVQQQRKLRALRETSERLFYATRAADVEIAQLEEVVLARSDRKDLSELLARKARLSQMEAEYDAFVKELGVYARLSDDERIILRTARAFGECEVNVPPDFIAEVKRYVQRWKESDRLANALRRSAEKGYGAAIQRVLVESGLPRQLVYLPLVESGYDERAVGPPTRYGHAKGMWQFISTTADHYGLRVGPLFEQPVFDPRDERFEWQKATTAATRYLHELLASDAQSSGLLAMACYNWGESNVRGLIERLPATPQDRNFWRLLRDKKVPRETYDYVLSIVSAAVICEDPKRFGFDLTCPAMQSMPETP